MNYGYFDDANREYVITNPRTPTKWINYIGTLDFGGFVDHTGGALICKGDPTFNRITKYIQQMPSSDFKGETLYLRCIQQMVIRFFHHSLSPLLISWTNMSVMSVWDIRGSSAKCYGIRTDVTIFVPDGEACEIRHITMTNISGLHALSRCHTGG